MLVVSSVKLKMKVAYMVATAIAVTMKPSVPALAQPKLQPKYSPEITSPTAMPHSCTVPSVCVRVWAPPDEPEDEGGEAWGWLDMARVSPGQVATGGPLPCR